MTKNEKTELAQLQEDFDTISNKLDLIYSLVSNQYKAEQALKVHSAIRADIEYETNEEKKAELSDFLEKAFEAFKVHSETTENSIEYFNKIHGTKSQALLEKVMARVQTNDESVESKVE